MLLRTLSCLRDVTFDYNIPLTREPLSSNFYADPKTVANIGFFVSRATDLINEKYNGVIKVDSQLDSRIDYNGVGLLPEVEGYYFSIEINRIDKEKFTIADLEKVVFEFFDIVPLKPKIGGAPSSLFEKFKEYKSEQKSSLS